MCAEASPAIKTLKSQPRQHRECSGAGRGGVLSFCKHSSTTHAVQEALEALRAFPDEFSVADSDNGDTEDGAEVTRVHPRHRLPTLQHGTDCRRCSVAMHSRCRSSACRPPSLLLSDAREPWPQARSSLCNGQSLAERMANQQTRLLSPSFMLRNVAALAINIITL